VTQTFVSNQEIILEARRNLEQGPWDYLVSGAESETTMRRNRLGFDRIALRPRVLRDVSRVDPSTTFLGHRLRIPVMLSPIGVLELYAEEGAVASAKAAAEFGTIQVLSSGARPGWEKTAASTTAPKVFQFSARGDMFGGGDGTQSTGGLIADAVKAGYVAVCLTTDTSGPSPKFGRRVERALLNRFKPPRMIEPDGRGKATRTWDTVDRIKEIAGVPLLVKGIATGEDAAIAVEHGVDVLWVSNHGGRNLDHGRGTIQMLPEIVQAVAGRAAVVLDGGIQRGGDVLKAIALGANAVAIGKLQGFGLAAAGVAGLVRVLEILEEEMAGTMASLGISRLDELDRSFVCAAEHVTWPHEMSQFVHLGEGRVR